MAKIATDKQLRVLECLKGKEMRVYQVAAKLNYNSSQTAYQALSSLKNKGWVERRKKDDYGKFVTVWATTREGLRVLEEAKQE